MPIKVLSSLPDCISVPAFWTRASVLSNSCILEGKRYCWNREHTEKPQGVTMTEEVKYHGPRSNWPISLPLMPDKNPEVKVVSLNKSIWKYPEGEISAGALKKKKNACWKNIVKGRSPLLVLQLVKMVREEAVEVWSTETWWMVPGWKLHLLESWSVQWMCLGTTWKLRNLQVSCYYSKKNNESQFLNTPSNCAFPLQTVLWIWAGGPQCDFANK